MSNPGVPQVAGRLLDVLIQRGNKSGAIVPAPHNLRNLKDSLQGVPFQLLQPGMAGVLSSGNLLSAIQGLIKMPGLNLGSIGKFQTILAQVTRGSAGVGQLTQALGAGAAIGSALMTFGGALATVQQGPGGVGPGSASGASTGAGGTSTGASSG